MSKITGVHHIALKPTADHYDKTVAFYQNLLGFAEVRSWGSGADRGIMLSCGDNTVMEIMSSGESNALPDGPFIHVAFSTDAVESLVADVRAAGYEVTMEPTDVVIGSVPPYPVHVAFFRGPIGEHIELFRVL